MMKNIFVASALALLASTGFAQRLDAQVSTQENPLQNGASWEDLRGDIVGEVDLHDGASLFEVVAPYRAHDAATVPLVIKQKTGAETIERAIVVIDENPAPMAADFRFGPAMGPLNFELRVRVNQYSNVRVLAETEADWSMTGRYVKASGGCSAPASRDPEVALASMGKMRLRHFETDTKPLSTAPATPALMSVARREAQIMIRHPNYSGLQRDQITQLFIGAHFIDQLEVFQGDEMLFTMTGGISVSENPVFRFGYLDNGAPALRVRAQDTEGNVFEALLPKSGES
jgi:sulfur-oxidizing protein SoxY